MFLLDTDHFSILQRKESLERGRLLKRMSEYSEEDIYVSVVSFHEQLLGANALIQQVRSRRKLLEGYDLLDQFLADYGVMTMLPYDEAAENVFERLRKQKIRIGTMDLRIAAIALVNGFTVLSRNLRDFHKVPALSVEDWTS